MSALVDVARSGSLEATKLFIESNPESLKERDAFTGRLPLHDLVMGWEDDLTNGESWRTVDLNIATYMIRLYPQCLSQMDDAGDTPLHSMMKRQSSSMDLFHLVYDGAQCVSGFANDKGQLPIHVAIENGSLKYAMYLLQQDYCMLSKQNLGIANRPLSSLLEPPVFHERDTLDVMLKLSRTTPELFETGCETYSEVLEPP